MFLAGVAIGGLVCGIISDKCGRKRTLMASLLIQSILGKYNTKYIAKGIKLFHVQYTFFIISVVY